MKSPLSVSRKVRIAFSKISSLLLLFQRSPVVQIILPEARVMSTTGVGELVKWSVATVVGLGAYDTVAGATTMTQIAPTPVVSPVPATTGVAFSMTVQVLGAPGNPGSWTITGAGLPTGIVKSNSGSTCTLSGTPTTAGSKTFNLIAWENTNGTGGSISKSFTINVAQGVVAPTITTHPVSTTINPNATATLTVAASGTSPTFQWYRGAKGVTTSLVAGATSASFTTPALTTTTSYWARATNSAGTADSNAATVTVRVPPAITTQPLSAQIGVGSTVTLTTAASGTSPTFQWYIGDAPDISNPISSATNATYTPPPLNTTTKYWVRASNAAGVANSNTATVTVDVPPVITSQPSSQTIASGGTATLGVVATGTALFFQWYIGDSGDTTNAVTTAGGDTATFTTPPLAVTTKYWVEVVNLSGDLFSNTATVTVATPPAITTQPVPVSIVSGTTATLTAAASGTSPTFQWYRGNTGDTSNPISGATSSSFTTPVLFSDTTYWVRASNVANSADSNSATVTIITPPVITTQPASVSIDSGNTATLTVAASGTSPTFQWYVGNSGDLSTPVSGATLASFTTPALTTATSYWVRATNAANTADSNTATVSINAAGGTIQNWSAAQFSPAQQADPAISGPAADPDGDGMTNEMEYVFGLSPLSSERSPETTLAVTSGNLSVTFTAKSASGAGYAGRVRHYAIETKPDLFSSAWSSPPSFSDIIASDQSVNYSAATAGPKQFCRLRVWLTP